MIQHAASVSWPNRVVVLGSTGFVGSALTKALDSRAVPSVGLASSAIDLIPEDSIASLKAAIEPGDALVFISALTPDRGRDARTLLKNVAMAVNVAQAIADAGLSHMVYISSDAVYADEDSPIVESTCCRAPSFHGIMHLARERIVVDALSRAAIPLMIWRPCPLFGPGDTHNSYGPNRFVRTALRDRKIALFGNGEEKRDHLYIDDFVRLLCLSLERRSAGLLNAASGTSATFREVADLVARRVGGGVSVEPGPRATPITHRHFDVSNRVAAFPSFVPTPLDEALAKTIESNR